MRTDPDVGLPVPEPEEFPISDELRAELRRRSENYRRNPHDVTDAAAALDEIEEELG